MPTGAGTGVMQVKREQSPLGVASAEADLTQDALAGEQFGGETDNEAEHGQAASPSFGEGHETEAGGGGISHWSSLVTKLEGSVKHRERVRACPAMQIRGLGRMDCRPAQAAASSWSSWWAWIGLQK